jgi:cytochrome d ubiquinol oxidase subunit II
VLGGFIQGVTVRAGAFAGGPFDWLNPYTLLVAAGLVAGYALLGATWLIWRTEDELHGRARRWAWIAGFAAIVLLGAVSYATLFVHGRISARWGFENNAVDVERLGPLLAIPALGGVGLAILIMGLLRKQHFPPFLGAGIIFLSGYLGLAVSFFPHIVPYAITFRQAANADNALALMLGGVAILLPAIIGYSLWVYWIFRGKVGAGAGYH